MRVGRYQRVARGYVAADAIGRGQGTGSQGGVGNEVNGEGGGRREGEGGVPEREGSERLKGGGNGRG
eukprot:1934457-Pleurochrysis_carterae.AAC.1